MCLDPGAQIDFQPDPALQPLIDDLARPTYDLERIVETFLRELRENPQRYG